MRQIGGRVRKSTSKIERRIKEIEPDHEKKWEIGIYPQIIHVVYFYALTAATKLLKQMSKSKVRSYRSSGVAE